MGCGSSSDLQARVLFPMGSGALGGGHSLARCISSDLQARVLFPMGSGALGGWSFLSPLFHLFSQVFHISHMLKV